MNGLSDIGRWIMILGGVLVLIGLVLTLGGRLGLGRLPGDIIIRKGHVTFYFPLVTSIILSLLLTLLFSILRR
jgi:hypothetical protein